MSHCNALAAVGAGSCAHRVDKCALAGKVAVLRAKCRAGLEYIALAFAQSACCRRNRSSFR